MKLHGFILLGLSGILMCQACAEEGDWNSSWDGMVYAYPTASNVRMDSVLNPDNQIAKLVQRSNTAEARFSFKEESGSLRFTLRPIMLWQQNSNAYGENIHSEGYISQGQLRWRIAEAWSLAGGREVMSWGPGQFRSPSNPFYFDNGRSNPIRELSGLDAVKVSWAPDTRKSLSVAYIGSAGHYEGPTDIWRDTWVLRASGRGSSWSGGLAVAKKEKQKVFVGLDAQFTVHDAWLLYGEAGSSTRFNALQSSADSTQPFSVEAESSRHLNQLFGATYTLENGQSLTTEYLHYKHGYTASEEAAYFERAANTALPAGAATLGMALANAPPLLGRNYLHIIWQNNLLESEYYRRLMLTRNLTDHGSQFSGYGEYVLSSRVSGFALAVLALGNERQEFSSLIANMATMGIKVALP